MSDAGSQVIPPVSAPQHPPPPYYGNYPNTVYYPYPAPPGYYGYGQPSMSDRPSAQTAASSSGFTKKKKVMAIAACFCIAVALILLALFIYALLRSRDKGTAPCDDFYSYACAKWTSHNISGVMEKGHATVQQEITDTIIRGLTEKADPSFARVTIFSMISACLNEEQIEILGKAPLLDFLDSLGGWPMVDGKAWEGDMDKAMHVLGDVTRIFGNNAIFAIDVVPNMLQDLKPIIYVQGSHGYLIPITPALFPFIPKFKSSTTELEQIIFEIVVAISGDVGGQKLFLVNEIKRMVSFWSAILKTKDYREFCHVSYDPSVALAFDGEIPKVILSTERRIRNRNVQTSVSDITTTILHTFTDELKKNDWLSTTSKNKIVDKISSLKFEIAFPSSVKNETVLEEIYKPLNISVDDHFQNILDSSELKSYLKLAYLIDDPKTRLIWRMPPLSVNAWYIQFGNIIQIFAGLLRAANVTSTSALAHQYGVLGSIIAHEITHALDFSGLKIDKHGRVGGQMNTLEGPLLDRKSAKEFVKKTDCLTSQYQGYCMDSKCIDGERTVNENLADNSGTRIAFLAFLKKVKGKTHIKSNDTIVPQDIRNASLKKQFFFYFNQVWCSEETTSELTNAQIDFDSHSPNKYRVIGTLSNLPDFAEEFECKVYDEMNRKRKCRVW